MKTVTYLTCGILFFSVLVVPATPVLSAPSDTIEHFPNYRLTGGTPTFVDEFANSAEYPRSGRAKGIIGTSLVYLTLSPAGKITRTQIVTSLGKTFDRELARVIPLTEKHWQPDLQEDRDLTFLVAFTFLIDGAGYYNRHNLTNIVTGEVPIVGYEGTNADIHDNEYHIERANRYYQRESYRKAIRELDELIRRDPFNRDLYLMRGYSHHRLNHTAEACRDFQLIKVLLKKTVPAAVENLCR